MYLQDFYVEINSTLMVCIPFFLNIAPHERVVLVGGGHIALAKAESLAPAGASLSVIAEKILPELERLVRSCGGSITVDSYRAEHIDGAKLVIAATGDRSVNEAIQRDAKKKSIFVNVVDTPELCDFIFPATVERGDIKIAISTTGISPTFARLIKRKIEQVLPWNLSLLTEWIGKKRATVQSEIADIQARRLFWEDILEGAVVEEVLAGNTKKADEMFSLNLKNAETEARAALWLVGAGRGHSDLITFKGVQLLSQADVIIVDASVAPDALRRFARKDAKKIPAHARDTVALLEEHLQKGRIVARLKDRVNGAGSHTAEEIAVAQRLNVPWQVAPASVEGFSHAG